MADGGLESAVKAPIGWAKARPFVFIIFIFIVVLLVLRFRHSIARWIAKIPKIGPWLVGGKGTVVPANVNMVGGVAVASSDDGS